MNVLILHSLAPEAAAATRHRDEFDLSSAVASIHRALPEATVAGVHGSLREIIDVLDRNRPDVVFNACEAPLGRPELEAHVAALLEWLAIPFTGSGSETLALCRRKDRTSAVLAAAGIPVPRPDVFPCIVKPADEDGSAGIDHDAICHNAAQLERARARIRGRAVVEEFIHGEEYVVSVWGPDVPVHRAIGHMNFTNGMRINTYASKWETDSPDYANTQLTYELDLSPALRARLEETAQATWHAVGARGYIRVDLRLDQDGIPRVFDVNPNPELGEGAGIHRAVLEAGWTWEQFLRQQIAWAQ